MSNENFMMPRYKLIEDYPNSEFRVGDVLEFKHIHPYPNYSLKFGVDKIVFPEYIDDFPHLFKKLQWWEDRNPEEMPKYLKMISYIKPCTNNPENFELKKGQVFKPGKFSINSFEIGHWIFSTQLTIPATKEEYESYTPLNWVHSE